MDWGLVVAGLGVGFVVGLTGMGGGALMTPLLVIVFGVDPLTAVSSDLVASLVMKPFGATVHARRGTVNYSLVRWLCVGSVPCAFAGVLVLDAVGGDSVADTVKVLLGVALLVAATSMVVRQRITRRRAVRPVDGGQHAIHVRVLPTVAVGMLGGFVVGMTSVGSGSLMIVALLLLYPTLTAAQLVGTDLLQAIPLVGAAALGHILFGDFQAGLTTALLVGAIPGVYLGARVSSRAPDRIVRPVLIAVLVLSGAKLLGASDVVVLVLIAVAVLTAMGFGVRAWLRAPASEEAAAGT